MRLNLQEDKLAGLALFFGAGLIGIAVGEFSYSFIDLPAAQINKDQERRF